MPHSRLNALMLATILVASCRLAVEAQAQPGNLEARVALVRTLIASGNSSRAQAEIALLLQQAPEVAIVHALSGMHLARVSNPNAARLAFAKVGTCPCVASWTARSARLRRTKNGSASLAC